MGFWPNVPTGVPLVRVERDGKWGVDRGGGGGDSVGGSSEVVVVVVVVVVGAVVGVMQGGIVESAD